MGIKQVLVVRKDLTMRMGKIAAQCAHASMKVFFDRSTVTQNGITIRPADIYDEEDYVVGYKEYGMIIPFTSEMYEWHINGFKKVCVYVNSEEELDRIYSLARGADIPSAMIIDSGRTEFKGVPTKTVVAIGPYKSESIDKITGHLKLL